MTVRRDILTGAIASAWLQPVDITAEMTDATSASASTDMLHIGNRWINHAGLGYYDNTARYYDALTVRFTAADSHEQKYYSLSPGSHCAGNPVNLIDSTGCDVCVIYEPTGVGHMGMLIQHSDKRWYLYSKNGARYSASSGNEGTLIGLNESLSSGEHLADLGEMSFKSPEEFFKSEYNQSRPHPYEEGLLYETTPAQDQAAVDAITEEINKTYDLLQDNCLTAVRAALRAIDVWDTSIINLGEVTIPFINCTIGLRVPLRVPINAYPLLKDFTNYKRVVN